MGEYIIKRIGRVERIATARGFAVSGRNSEVIVRASAGVVLISALMMACSQEAVSTDAPRPLEDATVYQNQPSPFRSEVVEVVLAPGEGTEVQSVLAEDQVILYQWNTDGAVVYSDFHGHDPADDSFWVQYRENLAGLTDYGSLVAPFSGQHGWYFRNDGQREIVVRLRVSGYFSEIVNHGIL